MTESEANRATSKTSMRINSNSCVDFEHISKKAYKFVNDALNMDERGQTEEAIKLYKTSIIFINEAINSKNGSKEDVTKLNASKKNVTDRLNSLIDQKIQSNEQAYLLYEIMEEDIIESTDTDVLANAEEIFSIIDAQLFYINLNGEVTAPSYPSKLGVYKFKNAEDCDRIGAPGFLRVGSWIYPLTPQESPSLYLKWGAYIFPDLVQEGCSIGLIFPDNTSKLLKDTFENIIKEYTLLNISEGQPKHEQDQDVGVPISVETKTTEKIAHGIEKTAEWIAKGVDFGAEKLGYFLHKGGNSLRQNIKPNQNPTHVSSETQNRLQTVRNCSHVTVRVSSAIVDCVGIAAKSLAKFASPHLRKGAEKVLPKKWTQSDGNTDSKIDEALYVGAHGVRGVMTVYLSLEEAAFALAKNLANETVTTVQHKYGNETGQATHNALYSAVNIGMTVNNAKNLGIKGIAKRVVKEGGKEIANEYSKN